MDALFHKLGPDPRYARCPSCGEEAVGCAICIARHYSNMSAPLTGAEVEELLALAERVGIEGEGAR
jgi:hypothetical protein